MYSLEINFLKDRKPYQDSPTKKNKEKIKIPIGNLTPVYLGITLAVFFPALAGFCLWLLQGKNAELLQNVTQLEQEKQQLEQQIASINKIKEETNRVKGETQTLVSVFDQIRPWSAMLQELRDRIPATVQIDHIRQIPPVAPEKGKPEPNPAGGVELTGVARTFNDVNDFMLTLEGSHFFKSTDTRIITAELVDGQIPSGITTPKGIVIKPPQVVKYTIQSTLSDVPASELIRELEQKGTVGLVARIRNLQQTGVIPK